MMVHELITTEEVEHINADRDIAHLMREREARAQQKLDDSAKAEAARLNMYMKYVRSFYHRASRITLVCLGACLAAAVYNLLNNDIWGFAVSILFVAATQCLARLFYKLYRKKGDRIGT